MQSSTTGSIPAAALAYPLNTTVVPQGPVGFLTAYPTGQSVPLAATLVWSQSSLTSDAAIVPAGTSGSVDVRQHRYRYRHRSQRLLRYYLRSFEQHSIG